MYAYIGTNSFMVVGKEIVTDYDKCIIYSMEIMVYVFNL